MIDLYNLVKDWMSRDPDLRRGCSIYYETVVLKVDSNAGWGLDTAPATIRCNCCGAIITQIYSDRVKLFGPDDQNGVLQAGDPQFFKKLEAHIKRWTRSWGNCKHG
jgi:hypothetical protein